MTVLSLSVLVFLLLFAFQSVLFKPLFYFLISLGLAGVMLGVFKLNEPQYSFTLSPAGIQYHHNRGSWFIAWSDIQRVDIPNVQYGLDQQPLPYVAIRLKSNETWLTNISPRLASYLLSEQKELLVLALKQDFANWQCNNGQCPSELMYKFDPIQVGNSLFKGLKAMLAHRVELLRVKLGYDVFIPASALDREPEQFVSLLQELRMDVASKAAVGES